jgi:tetratricopeptide (TPR) repeat protein
MGQLQKFKDHFILMVEAGFIAVNQADEDAALKLFKASQLLDPQNLLPRIGQGYIHLCKLELKQASKVFQEILDKDPSSEMAKTFLGLSLSLNPADVVKGEKVLEESAKDSKDPMVKNLAASALDFVEKFVKKPPTPLEGKAPEKKKKK